MRRPVAPATADAGLRQPGRPPVVSTGRVAVLLLVLAGLAFSAALPVRTYLRQRSQISALEQQVRQERAGVAQLETSAAQWQDPVFVSAQARERLGLVAPGETGYIVTDSAQTAAASTPAPGVLPAVSAAPGAGGTSGVPVLPPRRVPPAPVGPPALFRAPATGPTAPAAATATITVTGTDGLAALAAASPWWSARPSPEPTTAR